MLGIIGGSGLSQLASLEVLQRRAVRTPYGQPSGPLTLGRLGGRQVVFLARHGPGHSIAPHEINYRANLWALRSHQVDAVVSVATVGGIRRDLGPGVIVIPDQIVDYTSGRAATFFEGAGSQVRHIDFTHPYSRRLRSRLLAAARAAGEPVVDGAVYAATQGPRLETAAEIDRFERDGADLVGMTGMPEAALARELGLDYAAISAVANYAAGRGDSEQGILLERIEMVLEQAMGKVRRIIDHVVQQ